MPRKDRTRDAAPDVWLASSPAFFAGMDSEKDPRNLEEQGIRFAKNGYVARSGRVVRRRGVSAILDTPFTDPVKTVRRFRDPLTSTNVVILWTGTEIWARHEDGTLQRLTDSAGVPYVFGSSGTSRVAHCEFGGEVICSTVGAGVVALWVNPNPWAADVTLTQGGFTYNVKLSAAEAGADGNDWTLVVDHGTGISQPSSVTLVGTVITFTTATDGAGANASTLQDFVTAMAAATSSVPLPLESPTVTGTATALISEGTFHFEHGYDGGQLVAEQYISTYDFDYLAAYTSGERVFGIDHADPMSVRWCDALDASTWNSASVYRPGGQFTGLIELASGVMGMFQANDIYRIDGTDPTTWTPTKAKSRGLGLPIEAADTLVDVEGVIVYLSHRGLAVYDGAQPRVIGDQLKNDEDSELCFMPTDPGRWDGAFSLLVRDHIMLFCKSISTAVGCDMALLYDFRKSVWAGVFYYADGFTSGTCEMTNDGNAALMHLGCIDGQIRRENGDYDDDGTPFTMTLRSRTFDCGREAMDKQVIEMRATYKAAGATAFTMNLYREDETAPIATVTHTISGAEEDVVSKRVQHNRGRDFFIELLSTDDVYLEFGGVEFDYFFVALR